MIKLFLKLLPQSVKRKLSDEIKKKDEISNCNSTLQMKLNVNVVYCCICKQRSPMFLPFNFRHFVICPVCGSFERHRMVWYYLTNYTKILKNEINLLHFAPETVFYNTFKKMKINYFPVDFEPKGYGDDCKKMDATDIKHPDSFFDIIIANHLLEHVPDDKKAMSEFYRVLTPLGFAVITIPIKKDLQKTYEDFNITDPQEREKAFGQYDHVRWYGSDFIERLMEVGFKVEMINFTEILNSQERFKHGFSDEIIYICKK